MNFPASEPISAVVPQMESSQSDRSNAVLQLLERVNKEHIYRVIFNSRYILFLKMLSYIEIFIH